MSKKATKTCDNKLQKFLLVLSIVNFVAVAFSLFTIFTFAHNILDVVNGQSWRSHEFSADINCLKTQNRKDCIDAEIIRLTPACSSEDKGSETCKKLEALYEEHWSLRD